MIPVFSPSYGSAEQRAIETALKSGWTGLGPTTKKFEEAFAAYISMPYGIGTNSCTAALHLALKVLDLPTGSEVITTPLTFVSTNHAILYNNLTPVFCDIEPDTLNIDAQQIEKLITPRTKAIICVHYGGQACDMTALKRIARKHGLYLIEDCAHAAGGLYKNKKLGSFGDVSCFSFHAVKNISVGQGGMILTRNKKWYERLQKLRWVGISKDTWNRSDTGKNYSWYYDVEELGFLYHMADIPAALGLVQLKKIETTNRKRRRLAERYSRLLGNVPGVELLATRQYATSSYHNYVIKIKNRNKLIDFLKSRGIATSVHYYPNHLYQLYKPYYRPLPVTENVWQKIITLPLYPDLKIDEQDKVVKAITTWVHDQPS